MAEEPFRVSAIVAADERDTIGREGGLPWHLPEDLQRFQRITTGHVVVAGRLTHESIVAKLGRPLPRRTTVVVTRGPARPAPESVHYAQSVDEALALAQRIEAANGAGEVFVIGGAQIYAAAMDRVRTVYLTRVHGSFAGDTALPGDWLAGFGEPVERDERDGFTFETYERR
jgi:dihydrofolate reductase